MDATNVDQAAAHELGDLPQTIENQAAAWFLKYHNRRLTSAENAELQTWLAASPAHAAAWRDMAGTWESFDDHAMLPELMVARERALASVRRTQRQRWVEPAGPRRGVMKFLGSPTGIAATVAILVIALGVTWKLSVATGTIYHTGIGEQRTVLLADNSRMMLDALTQVRVRYDSQLRSIELLEGQAQFDVAPKSNRPFKVFVGSRVVEALGTSFTVSYINERVDVALLEGRVKVETRTNPSGDSVDSKAQVHRQLRAMLKPGEMLRVEPDGRQALDSKVDVTAVTAWREGKVVFQQTPLRDAVERLNRYSRVRLEVTDPTIDQWPVSGIFGVGDAEAFAEAIATYFPIESQEVDGNTIQLRRRQ